MTKPLRLSATGGAIPAYIEEVFSTYLYDGNGSTQTITNNIDLSTKGGLVWIKSKANVGGTGRHSLWDTARGRDKTVVIDTPAQDTGIGAGAGVTSFNTNGFSLGTPYYETNVNTDSVVAWTFRKQPKFFDVVTYTGDSNAGRTIAHSLGSTPGCIIVKRTSGVSNWAVYHRGIGGNQVLQLNNTNETSVIPSPSTYWNNTNPTSTVFTVGDNLAVNQLGDTYVAYIFAHNAGGFGASGNDNVITCGTYAGNGSTTNGPVITLGYEPQWLLVKCIDYPASWQLVDNMRGFWVGDATTTAHSPRLQPNLSDPQSNSGWVIPTATGFQLYGANASATPYNSAVGNYIYIAIRKGPMKAPTTGTSVFTPIARAGNNNVATGITNVGFPPDLSIVRNRDIGGVNFEWDWQDRLRGIPYWLDSSATMAETYNAQQITQYGMTGVTFGTDSRVNGNSAQTYINYFLRRAPGFFDEVCYTGTGSNLTVNHNLGVVPELMILKARSNAAWWPVYCASVSVSGANVLDLSSTSAAFASSQFNGAPTTTTFQLVNSGSVNTAGQTQAAWLFASCPGVSKVGSYTGNGSSQTINCGFTGGARFVLIKRTDNTGDWYVWDTARGIVSGNDPHLSLNSTAAEVTTDDTIDPDSTGFIVNQLAATNVNVNTATYIYLAIA